MDNYFSKDNYTNKEDDFVMTDKIQAVERSIIKTYRKTIWNQFIGGIKDYQLISEGDCIGVCISGGKDSMLLAKCMQQLQRHSYFNFTVKYIVMDPGYSETNRKKIEDNAKLLGVPVQIFDSNIFSVVEKTDDSPCYLCARMRRGHLYKFAQSLGCNKIALGHHFDDVIETVMMSMLYGGEIKTMVPKLVSTNYDNMELIRPLYLVKERYIIAWKNYNKLDFLNCACKMTEKKETGDAHTSKRAEIKELIASLRKINSNVDSNIFKSVHNVNLNMLLGFTLGNTKYSFLENFDLNNPVIKNEND